VSRLEEYRAAVEQYGTLRGAARAIGVSAEAIRQAFNAAGIPTPKSRGGRPRQRTPEQAKIAERERKRKVSQKIRDRKKAAKLLGDDQGTEIA
jgi:DNA-binding transcriptional MerR regulator